MMFSRRGRGKVCGKDDEKSCKRSRDEKSSDTTAVVAQPPPPESAVVIKSNNSNSGFSFLALLILVVASLLFSRRYRICIQPREMSFHDDDNIMLMTNDVIATTATTTLKEQSNDDDNDDENDNEKRRSNIIKQIQMVNYRKGTGLILNFHITHHGGTHVCEWAKQNVGSTPNYYCIGGKNVPQEFPKTLMNKHNIPWPYDQTNVYVQQAREHFQYLSWEWGPKEGLSRSVNATNWEHSNLVSIIVMRNPLDRLISSYLRVYDPTNPKRETHQGVDNKNANKTVAEAWWDCANSPFSDNYALRKITSKEGCCSGAETPREYLEMAKSYLRRFTVILDLDCLDESLLHLSKLLNISSSSSSAAAAQQVLLAKQDNVHVGHDYIPPRERMQNDTLYEYLVRRNQMDLLLYNWSRTRALVQCKDPTPIVDLNGIDFELV